MEDPSKIEDAEDFLLRVRSILHLEGKRNQNQLTHQLQEKAADILGYPGRVPSAAGRTPDERLLPPRARRHAIAGVDAQDGADACRVESRAHGRRHPLHRHAPGRRAAGDVACRVSGGDRRTTARSPTRRCRSSVSTPSGFASKTSFRRRQHRAALLHFLKPAAGLYARLSEMHDCGLLGPHVPASFRRSRIASFATSSTGTRWTSTRC